MVWTVAIVGRPNVGKSTLFNRMAGKKLAIVHDRPGVTRDWRIADASFYDLDFRIIDTAGLEDSFDGSIESRMRQQTEQALSHADMVLMVIDARAGLTPLDRHFAEWLRKRGMPTLVVANKCESRAGDAGLYEAFALGLGDPVAVSAEHGTGMSDLYDALRARMPKAERPDEGKEDDALLSSDGFPAAEESFPAFGEGEDKGFGDLPVAPEEEENPIKVAIVGRPNVGKSTLINAILGEQRMMTGPEAGITRDAIAVYWEHKGRKMRLVDTAGLRRKAKITDSLERLSVDETLRAIRLAQVVVLVIDAAMPLERQDLTIASLVIREGRALVIAVNKWDSIKEKKEALEEIRYRLAHSLAQVRDVPVVTISALNGRLGGLMDGVLEIFSVWNSRVPTWKLNRWLKGMESANPAPLVQGRPNRLRYITQIKARPPSFALWVSRPDDFPDSYLSYLVNALRRDFDMPGVPVRIHLKSSKNPYAD